MARKESDTRYRTVKAPKGFSIERYEYLKEEITGLKSRKLRVFFRRNV